MFSFPCQSAPETLKQHLSSNFLPFQPIIKAEGRTYPLQSQREEMHTGCTEGTRNIKGSFKLGLKVSRSLFKSPIPQHSNWNRFPAWNLQCRTPRQQCQGKCGGKKTQNKTRIKLIYSVSCAICLVTYKLSCNNPLCFTYSDCHLVEALFLGGENS